jgi:hypothetical protein
MAMRFKVRGEKGNRHPGSAARAPRPGSTFPVARGAGWLGGRVPEYLNSLGQRVPAPVISHRAQITRFFL